MSKIVLGLDLGITSIGWALVNVDDDNLEKNKIIDSGVRIFTVAEHPKDGKSLALPRREARSARRTTKRKAQKLRVIKRMLIKNQIITQDELNNLFIGNKNQVDVWQLRKKALYNLIDNKELSRIMIHLAKHRGYRSNRKSEDILADDNKIKETEKSDDKKEKQGIKAGINKNIAMMQKQECKTIGELLSNQDKKRNSKGNYDYTVSRNMLENEIEIIFSKQKEFDSKLVNDELLQTYKEIAFEQRPLKSVADMVGKCPFEPDQYRASKSSYTFELFRALQKLKNLRIITMDGEISLSKDEVNQVIHKAKIAKFTYKTLKKLFSLEEVLFKGLTYFDHKTGESVKKDPESEELINFTSFRKIQKSIQTTDNLYWQRIENDVDILDAIAQVLTTEKNDIESIKQLKEIIDSEKVCEALVSLSFSQFGHLSNKALKNIIPFLEEGENYDKSCDKAGYDFKAIFKGGKTSFLPPLTEQENLEMTNPVVKRAIAQMRLVYNAIARKYGKLDAVHVEFTRDIKNSKRERDKIDAGQKEFKRLKEIAKDKAIEVLDKDNPSPQELLKFRLWEQQKHCCIYSGKSIRPSMLSDEQVLEVDHILPQSRSLDDSLNNKVLCLIKENQEKENQTPFEYMGSDESSERWQDFVGRVNKLDKNLEVKKRKLLKIKFDTSSEKEFLRRNLNDTAYISKFVKNYIEAHIEFKKSKDKQHVFTRNGMLTSQLRFKWGVGDKNRNNHLHHAEDAIIVAFSTQAMVKKLSDVSKKRELKEFKYKSKEEKSKALRFITPLDEFHNKVQESLANIFVSHMPSRKVGGAAHKKTIYSKNKKSKGIVEINYGLAENGEVKRIDIFEKDKKFHFVYLYALDFVKEEIKNITIKDKQIDETYIFRFSIFKNDLLEIELKDKKAFGYMKFAEGDGRFNIIPQSHAELNKKIDRYSTGSMKDIKKYQVDALGNYVEVKSEKRQMTIKNNWSEKLKKRAIRRMERRKNKVIK